ncbi:MAG TPA: hypothetical protein VE954_42215 [Oligoflexus sp.]|uniref:hypothetical protein n=1 Tax=Oligoflexus sp. TaxID=1971216 RepID=UPI002D56E64B|nr:hypothetical protein [Oligoflexus sp.]HYX39756.1 hypothetical protein [Oligoflexus sp.]
MTGFRPHTSAASDAERLRRLFQKLDSWEVLLESKGAQDRDWQKRRKRLHNLRQRLELLRLRTEAPTVLEQGQTYQLPPLDICTSDEHILCDQYLEAQLKISQHLNEQLTKVKRWVEEASAAGKNSWRMKLRLTKIRRYLGDLDQERQTLEPHRIRQLQNWEKFADKMLLYRDQYQEMGDTRLAFEKIVRLTDSVEALQQKVHASQNKIQRMEAWLKQATRRLLQTKSPLPPLAEDLRMAAQKIDGLGLEDLHRSKSRLALARKYLEKYLSRTPDLPSVEDAS